MAPSLAPSYELWTRRPVVHLPVVLRGELVGALYCVPGTNIGGYKSRIPAGSVDDRHAREDFWCRRLAENYRQNLPPEQAIKSWRGVGEHPRCGGIPADAEEQQSPTLQQLWDQLNPEGPPLGDGPWIQDGEFPDGTPVDRPEVVECLHRLHATDRARVDFAASLLAEYGPTLSEPYCKHLGDGFVSRFPPQRPSGLPTGFPVDHWSSC